MKEREAARMVKEKMKAERRAAKKRAAGQRDADANDDDDDDDDEADSESAGSESEEESEEEPEDDDAEPDKGYGLNKFGSAFQEVVSETNARVRIDSFEHCVVEVKKEDLGAFLESLSMKAVVG
ncbi:hypothetical protein E4U41_000301 [Claviceps citrina]|nr:hypothetical protein E4U41_000301 [Claviceps citrina]